MKSIVTLVHGTWSPNARWVSADSTLRKKLSSLLQGDVEFREFRWTGGNKASDRFLAAEALVRQLESQNTAGIAQYAIAHSHGGNVALRAAAACDGTLNGLVTLNTPFLVSVRTDIREAINGTSLALALVILWWWCAAAILGAIGTGLAGAGIAATLVAIVAARIGLRRTAVGGARRLRHWTRVPALKRTRVLSINAADDEALHVLRLADGLGSGALALPMRLLTILVLLGSLAAFTLAVTTAGGMQWNEWIARSFELPGLPGWTGSGRRVTRSLSSAGLTVAAFAILLAALHLAALVWLLRNLVVVASSYLLLGLSQGTWRSGFLPFLVRSVTSLSPVGVRDLTFRSTNPLKRRALLTHSALYRDERVLRWIADWIAADQRSSAGPT